MKLLISGLLCFILGYITCSMLDDTNKKQNTVIVELKKDIVLYYNGKSVGELYKGAQLVYNKGTNEGFQQAIIYMNYYEKTDSLKYYEIINTGKKNLIIPYWNDQDVSLIQ